MNIHIINGPNLNMLGKREASHYGSFTLKDIEEKLLSEKANSNLSFFQSNSEGAIVDNIQSLEGIDGIIINAGAYTHTSIAIRDALLAVQIEFIEVHISNVYAREDFRQESYLSDIAAGVIAGLGMNSYSLALQHFLKK